MLTFLGGSKIILNFYIFSDASLEKMKYYKYIRTCPLVLPHLKPLVFEYGADHDYWDGPHISHDQTVHSEDDGEGSDGHAQLEQHHEKLDHHHSQLDTHFWSPSRIY